MSLEAALDVVVDEFDGLSELRRLRHGGCDPGDIVSCVDDRQGRQEVDIKNPAHLEHLQLIDGLESAVAHGLAG